MLKTIAELSPQLVSFVLALHLSLSCPQVRHIAQVADALITIEGSKTLSSLPDEVRVFISKKHNGDKRLRYYCSTDPSLSAEAALHWFHHRWSCEVANLYIQTTLSLSVCGGPFWAARYDSERHRASWLLASKRRNSSAYSGTPACKRAAGLRFIQLFRAIYTTSLQ
jgi:hypothetical protein